MDSTAQSILTNPEVIAVDQAGVLPRPIVNGTAPVWAKTLPDGTVVVGLFNLGSSNADIPVSFAALGLAGDADVRDLVARADLGTFTDNFTAQAVPSHGSRLLKLTSEAADALTGYTYCAREYENCATNGAVDVAFGAGGLYVYTSALSGTFACDVSTFGTDPAYGSTKGCYSRPQAGGGPPGFTACATEGQTCTPNGDVDVAYGAVGSFLYQTGSVGSFGCSVAHFGSDPAYGWNKGCYTRPSGGGVAYEAEGAALAGAAVVEACSLCAGGKKVGYLGNGTGNAVTFPDIDVAESGTHTLVIHGASADPRSFAVSVNGGAPMSVGVQSGSWTTPTTVSVAITLQAGSNTVTLGNPSEYAPDLDRIVVR
jgi:alpha-galactosidase